MSKAEINLLPPIVKRERFSRLVQQQLSRLYWWVVVVTSVTTVALGISWFVLQQTNHRLQTAAGETSQRTEGAAVRNLNQLVRAMHSRIAVREPWGRAVTDVLTVVVPELQLLQLEVPAGTQQLLVTGVSANRAAVADLEQRFKGLVWVEKVEAPLANLVLGGDGIFTFTLQRKTAGP